MGESEAVWLLAERLLLVIDAYGAHTGIAYGKGEEIASNRRCAHASRNRPRSGEHPHASIPGEPECADLLPPPTGAA